jgi:hypothetical protein
LSDAFYAIKCPSSPVIKSSDGIRIAYHSKY